MSAKLNAAYTSKLCDPMSATTEPGTAVYRSTVGPSAAHPDGGANDHRPPPVIGPLPRAGRPALGRLAGGTRQIVALGVVRPVVNQSAGTSRTALATQTLTFQLDPDDYTFAPGHTIELELVGSTAPLFRKSNGTFAITVSKLTLSLPTT